MNRLYDEMYNNIRRNKVAIKSAIFDLDGTLLDTSEGIISSVTKLIEHFGYGSLTPEQYRSFIGPPINRHLKAIFGLSDEESIEAMNYFRVEYAKGDIYRSKIYDGLVDLLQNLRKDGIKLGVSTYKREDMAKSLLEEKGLAELFDVIHGSDAAATLSKADVVTMTINDLGNSASETVMIGDSDNDAIGAEGAGAKFIGVTYGFGFKDKTAIEAFANIGIADSCEEIFSIIHDVNNSKY